MVGESFSDVAGTSLGRMYVGMPIHYGRKGMDKIKQEVSRYGVPGSNVVRFQGLTAGSEIQAFIDIDFSSEKDKVSFYESLNMGEPK